MQVQECTVDTGIIYLTPDSDEDRTFLEKDEPVVNFQGRKYEVIDSKIGIIKKEHNSTFDALETITVIGSFLGALTIASPLVSIAFVIPISALIAKESISSSSSYMLSARISRLGINLSDKSYFLNKLSKESIFTGIKAIHFCHPDEVKELLSKSIEQLGISQSLGDIACLELLKEISSKDLDDIFRTSFEREAFDTFSKCLDLYEFLESHPEYFHLLSDSIKSIPELTQRLKIIDGMIRPENSIWSNYLPPLRSLLPSELTQS